jgi:hypothetical protein
MAILVTAVLKRMGGGRFLAGYVLLLFLLPLALDAQTSDSAGYAPGASSQADYLPDPGDVLTPNTRRNTPYLKIGVRLGVNRSAYSNDVYLDNVPLDVGKVSGEAAIYSTSAGFGYSAGVDLEYPINSGLSLRFSGQYDHVVFGSSGTVKEPCVNSDGDTTFPSSVHDFAAHINYLNFGAAARLDFSKFYLLFGLAAGRPLTSSLTRTKTFGGENCAFVNSGGKGSIEESGPVPDLVALHYALRMGAGLTYQLNERLFFSPELLMDFGFNQINKSPNSDLGVYSISATLRYDI